jgi:hypothetical protein
MIVERIIGVLFRIEAGGIGACIAYSRKLSCEVKMKNLQDPANIVIRCQTMSIKTVIRSSCLASAEPFLPIHGAIVGSSACSCNKFISTEPNYLTHRIEISRPAHKSSAERLPQTKKKVIHERSQNYRSLNWGHEGPAVRSSRDK